MRRSIVVLAVAAAAIGLATPALAELLTLDAVVFSPVPLAQMTPQMEIYFITRKDGDEVRFAARWCALLRGNTPKPLRPER